MKPHKGLRKFRETRYAHQRSEGLTTRRSNGATKALIIEKETEHASEG